jgi:diaminopimelate epimerase
MRSSTWRAAGNIYLLVERADLPGPLTAAEVRRLCRNGADGLLEIVSAGDAEAEIVIWNADGSTAELSGNGTRIVARWLAERTGAEVVSIRVGPRKVVARMLEDSSVEQEMGEVTVGALEIVAGIELTSVSVGNPHAVVRGDPADVERIGPLLETHPRFPKRTNVQVVHVERHGEVTARVWERGVGETLSSGTSAVAVAAATHREGSVIVHFPGGDLLVRLDGNRAYLTGRAERAE